jgi:hypothetical protein
MVRTNLSGEAVSIARPMPTAFGPLLANSAVLLASFDMPPLHQVTIGNTLSQKSGEWRQLRNLLRLPLRRVVFAYMAKQPGPVAGRRRRSCRLGIAT